MLLMAVLITNREIAPEKGQGDFSTITRQGHPEIERRSRLVPGTLPTLRLSRESLAKVRARPAKCEGKSVETERTAASDSTNVCALLCRSRDASSSAEALVISA